MALNAGADLRANVRFRVCLTGPFGDRLGAILDSSQSELPAQSCRI